MTYYIRNGSTFRVASEESLTIGNKLPTGNYTVKFDEMTGQFFLEIVDSFEPAPKLYGNISKQVKRIINTFFDRSNSTGVMLNGEKGSGKTLLAKTLSIELAKIEVPTIIVNQAWTGDTFNKFLQDIEQPCMVLFDEFEKVYDNEDQEKALTLLDGVFQSKKLFVITCNDKWRVNEHMRNRPGRIYYMIEFDGLDVKFIQEYCEDKLNNKKHIEKMCQISVLFDKFNFDMLKAIVEEMNRYDETPQEVMEMLNTKAEFNGRTLYDVQLFDKRVITSKKLDIETWKGNPLSDAVKIDYDDEGDGWVRCEFNASHLKSVDYSAGRFFFENTKGQKLQLTRQSTPKFDYFAF